MVYLCGLILILFHTSLSAAFTARPQSATTPEDYGDFETSGQVTITAGNYEADMVLEIKNDGIVEGLEQLEVSIDVGSNPSHRLGELRKTTVTISSQDADVTGNKCLFVLFCFVLFLAFFVVV